MVEVQGDYNKSRKLDLCLLPTSKEITHNTNSQIAPLQPPGEENVDGWERLAAQARRINQMAADLEVGILEFKALATNLNSQQYCQQSNGEKFPSICEYFAVSVPWVKQKRDRTLVLTTRKVDLFRAEREAAQLAQKLRQKNRRRSIKVNGVGV
jgi:hypothetical protein